MFIKLKEGAILNTNSCPICKHKLEQVSEERYLQGTVKGYYMRNNPQIGELKYRCPYCETEFVLSIFQDTIFNL